MGLSDIFIWVTGQSFLTSICSESASVCFFYKKKLLPSLFLKSNLLIYLAVHIQFVPVYIHTHFKDRYQHHQFLPILNPQHQTSSPIIRYHHSHYFFTIKTQKDNHDEFVLLASRSSIITSAAKLICLSTTIFIPSCYPPPPHHTLMHNASSSSKHMMMMMTY